MNKRARGFTILELMVAVIVGGILTQMAIKGFGMVSSRVSAREARVVFHGLVSRTRAQAVESGSPAYLIADAGNDQVLIYSAGSLVERVDFMKEMHVDVQADETVFRVCMTPRGLANPVCNSFDSTISLKFVRGASSEDLKILPMGQLRW